MNRDFYAEIHRGTSIAPPPMPKSPEKNPAVRPKNGFT